MEILDKSKLKSKTESEGVTTYIIENGAYLGEVFDSLPHGIINKSETGMGATTLELNSHRNSIIVEPTKITASSKAQKHNALYVGSPTKFHKKQITDKKIKEYIEDEKVSYKKIVVVADSLGKVMQVLGDKAYDEYYLFLDEIDSFQMDSTFRDSMEECLDYYKKLPVEKRLMVSATLMKFTDPKLSNEPYTAFQYENPTPRTIDLVHVDSEGIPPLFQGSVLEKIKDRLKDSPNEKIMVAYNSVRGCFTLAKELIKQNKLLKKEVSILCSASNKGIVRDLYGELEDETLPKRLTFATSAYFTGYDLKENYHLISVSGVQNRIHSLSEKKLKQIAGRCRKSLLSETVIYETRAVNEVEVTFKELVKSAKKEILAVECIESNYSNDGILKRQIDEIRKLILEGTSESGFRLARRSIDKENVISYLNIDANLENQRVRRELYQEKTKLKSILEDGNNLSFQELQPSNAVALNDDFQEIKEENIRNFIKKLREIPADEINPSYKPIDQSQRENEIFDFYEEYLPFIDGPQLLDKIEEVATDRDNRALNNLRRAAMIATFPDDHPYILAINRFLLIGQKYTNLELIEKWNSIFQSLTISKTFSSDDKVIQFTKLHFLVTKLKKPVRFKLKRNNPEKFITHHTRPNSYDFTAFVNELFNTYEYYQQGR